MIMSKSANGNEMYSYGPDGIEASGNGIYLKDIHGNVTEVIGTDNIVQNSYAYDGFGNILSSTGTISNPFGYCGEYYDEESGNVYLRNRYYNPLTGRFITEDPIKDGTNWYVYCSNNPIMFVDPLGLEEIVVAGGAYHQGNGNPYQYTFVDSALKDLEDKGGGTLLVANAGWSEDQYNKIVQTSIDNPSIKLLFFSNINSLTNYINNGGEGGRSVDPITSFTVYAHGTDSGSGDYAITFGLYSENDFRWYTSDIYRIKSSAFSYGAESTFYSCRTGNEFNNGNFAQTWANKTGGITYAFKGINGRSQYSNINGTKLDRMIGGKWERWYNQRGEVDKKPGAAYHYPEASYLTTMKGFKPKR